MENETRIERGQMYYLRENNAFGHEIANGRPIIVVSSAESIERSGVAVGVYTTTKPKYGPGIVKAILNNRVNYVMCNQIATVDASRLDTYMCQVDAPTMKRVNGALAYILCLQGEIVANENTKVEEEEKDVDDISLRVELEMYQKLYQKAISDLVDVSHKYNVLKLEHERTPKPIIVDPPTIEVDVNALKNRMMGGTLAEPVDREEAIPPKLQKVYSEKKPLTPERIDQILAEAGKRTSTSLSSNGNLSGKAKLNPTARPININTATVADFESIGMGTKTAENIVTYRRKNGNFMFVEDLLRVARFGRGCLVTYGPMLEV